MTSKEKIRSILNWVQGSYIDWNFMQGLKQDLEELVNIAQTEANHQEQANLSQFESIGMEPDELRKAADIYRAIKDKMEV